MPRLAAKHATRIATLFNSITVADLFIRDEHAKNSDNVNLDLLRRWRNSREEAATALFRDYGIHPIGVSIPD